MPFLICLLRSGVKTRWKHAARRQRLIKERSSVYNTAETNSKSLHSPPALSGGSPALLTCVRCRSAFFLFFVCLFASECNDVIQIIVCVLLLHVSDKMPVTRKIIKHGLQNKVVMLMKRWVKFFLISKTVLVALVLKISINITINNYNYN